MKDKFKELKEAHKTETGRPIHEWLNELPEPYRTEALVNAALSDWKNLETIVTDKEAAIGRAFDWYKSKEGHIYWLNLSLTLEPKPPIPSKDEYPGMVTAYPNDKRFQQLARLMWLRDETWRRDGNWKPDWERKSIPKCAIFVSGNRLEISEYTSINMFLAFSTKDLAQQFLDTHKDLIEECKEFL